MEAACKYQRYDAVTLKDEKKESDPINDNLLIPYMSAMTNIPSHLILGSVNGDLHLHRQDNRGSTAKNNLGTVVFNESNDDSEN